MQTTQPPQPPYARRHHQHHQRRRRPQQQQCHSRSSSTSIQRLVRCVLWLTLLDRTVSTATATTAQRSLPPLTTTHSAVRITPTTALHTAANSSSDDVRGTVRAATTIVSASDVSSLLDAIGTVDCTSDTRSTITQLFTANAPLLETCRSDTGYRLYPYAGAFPSTNQISSVCGSPSCMDLLSGVVLARLPTCDMDAIYSIRALAETFFRVRVDLANARVAPTTTAFAELYALNKLLSILQTNATAAARVNRHPLRLDVLDVVQSLNPVEINPDVVLSKELVVYVQQTASAAAGSLANANATTTTPAVTAPSPITDSSSSNTNDAIATATPAASDVMTTIQSSPNVSIAYVVVGLAWVVVNASFLLLMHNSNNE